MLQARSARRGCLAQGVGLWPWTPATMKESGPSGFHSLGGINPRSRRPLRRLSSPPLILILSPNKDKMHSGKMIIYLVRGCCPQMLIVPKAYIVNLPMPKVIIKGLKHINLVVIIYMKDIRWKISTPGKPALNLCRMISLRR
ncbi:MAG: hypothetical protein CBC48_11995 [bacterium TMED88]|nr:MAG: hypothetical protein CBC48_11995 [bacterium TMED88]